MTILSPRLVYSMPQRLEQIGRQVVSGTRTQDLWTLHIFYLLLIFRIRPSKNGMLQHHGPQKIYILSSHNYLSLGTNLPNETVPSANKNNSQ